MLNRYQQSNKWDDNFLQKKTSKSFQFRKLIFKKIQNFFNDSVWNLVTQSTDQSWNLFAFTKADENKKLKKAKELKNVISWGWKGHKNRD